METNDSPCYECLCLPACKGKVFSKLIQCSIVYEYLQRSEPFIEEENYESRILSIVMALGHPIIYSGLKGHRDYQRIFQNDFFKKN